MILLAELDTLDPIAGTRKTIRVTNANIASVTSLNGVSWRPAMASEPELSMRTFKGDFDGQATVGVGSMSILLGQIVQLDANAKRFAWGSTKVKIWAGVAGQAWPWTQYFDGEVDAFTSQDGKVSLTLKVSTKPFEREALYLSYAGTGGLEGGSDLAGRPKPWLLGRCKGVEPVLINATDSVFQVSAYGAISAVTGLFERGAAFGASAGDYPTYAALVAGAIPAGRWATCLASGLIRLGAPPYGTITADVDGDAPGGTWRRKTGEIITRIATGAGLLSSDLDATSMTALDTALAAFPNQGRIGVYLTEQIDVMSLAAQLAAPCNAQAGISLMGKLFAVRPSFASPSLTLDAQQRRQPVVGSNSESGVSPPFSTVEMGYERCWRVHQFSEIAFYATLIDLGAYDAATVYREGNIITDPATGKRYLYINPTPSAGNAPPNVLYWDDVGSSGAAGTTRHPEPVPVDPAVGWLYFDATGRTYRFEGYGLTDDQGSPILDDQGNQITTDGWVEVRDDGIAAARAIADAAAIDAARALADLVVIGSDGWLSKGEKGRVEIEYAAMLGRQTGFNAKAVALGVGATERTAAATEMAALTTYLNGLSPAWNNRGTDTPIVFATWQAKWTNADAAIRALEIVIQGLPGIHGIDGIDGADGKLVEFIWKRAASTPATPTGNGIPAGWDDEPPAGSSPLWMSKGKQELDGTLIGAWSAPVRHDGPPGADGSNGVSPVSAELRPASFNVLLDASGAPKAGELYKAAAVTAYQGGSGISVTSVSVVSGSAVGGTFSIVSGELRMTAISAESGSVEVDIVAAGQTVRKRLTFNTTRDGSDGSVATTLAITSPQINSTSYMDLGTALSINASSTGKLKLNLTGNYFGDTFQGGFKLQISTTGGASWSDISGTESTGTLAEWTSDPVIRLKGNVNGSGPYTITGYSADQPLMIKVQGKKLSGSASVTEEINLKIYAERVL